MAESELRVRSKVFAKEIVLLYRKLKKQRVEIELIKQMLRAGTSIGANIFEAQFAQGGKDFISKYEIALKECNETAYWLELLYDVESLSEEDFKKYSGECVAIRRMLIASVKTMKEKSRK